MNNRLDISLVTKTASAAAVDVRLLAKRPAINPATALPMYGTDVGIMEGSG